MPAATDQQVSRHRTAANGYYLYYLVILYYIVQCKTLLLLSPTNKTQRWSPQHCPTVSGKYDSALLLLIYRKSAAVRFPGI